MTTKTKIPRAFKTADLGPQMERRASAFHEAGRIRALALANLDRARAALIKADRAMSAALPSRSDKRNAADVRVCAALFEAEDAFHGAVAALAAASETYRKAFDRFVLAPETPAQRKRSLRARAV